MPQDHDSRYKALFSSPRLVRELLESFVPEPWVKKVDYEHAENVTTTFISEGFSLRESDLIWKLPLQDQTVYLFLLLEFQSTSDRYMALRVCHYILELYERLFQQESQRRKKLLPAVFPLVLYNGEDRWSAPERLEELIEPVVDSQYLPRFRYFKLAENEVSLDVLDGLNNLISVLFQVETLDPEEVGKKAAELAAKLKGEDKEDTLTFARWLAHYYGETDHPMREAMEPFLEVQSMLEARLKAREAEWERKYRQEGRQEGEYLGIQKGRLEGRQEGYQDGIHDVARRMKEEGLQVAIIAAVTGLSESVIQGL